MKSCLKWNLFSLIYRSYLHLALHSSLTICVSLLFKRKTLTIAELLQNCPINAALPGCKEPFMLGQLLAPHFHYWKGKVLLSLCPGGGGACKTRECVVVRELAVSHWERRERKEGGLSSGSGHYSEV